MADQSLRRTKSKQNLRKNPENNSVTRHHVDYRNRSSSSLGLYLGLLGCFIVVGAVLLIAQAYRGPRLYDSTIYLGKNAVPSEGNSRETPIPKQETSPDKYTTEGPKPEPKSNSAELVASKV
jgi:cytoskeletal protein RodZ